MAAPTTVTVVVTAPKAYGTAPVVLTDAQVRSFAEQAQRYFDGLLNIDRYSTDRFVITTATSDQD